MPFRLTPPHVETFTLNEFDDTGETFVSIRRATRGDHDERTDLNTEVIRILQDNQKLCQRISLAELQRLEVCLTLANCNIEDEHGNPLFEFSEGRVRDRAQFYDAWAKLSNAAATAIHRCVLQVNRDWTPQDEEK